MSSPQVVLVQIDSPVDVFTGVAEMLGGRVCMEVGTVQQVLLATLGAFVSLPESTAFRGEDLTFLVLLLPASPVVVDLPPLVVEPVLLSPLAAGFTRRTGTQDLMLRGASRDVGPALPTGRGVVGWCCHRVLPHSQERWTSACSRMSSGRPRFRSLPARRSRVDRGIFVETVSRGSDIVRVRRRCRCAHPVTRSTSAAEASEMVSSTRA